MSVILKTKEEIEIMKEGGRILALILNSLKDSVRIGMETNELENLAQKLIKENNVESSFLGYNNFPAVLCISINEEVVHGIPSDRTLKDGDILSIDAGIKYKDFHVDSAVTVIVGEAKKEKHEKLLSVTREALNIGISKAKPGNTIGDIGAAIEDFVYSKGFMIVEDLVGHGIGKSLHEAPEVPNYGQKGTGLKLEPGMVIAIEPMVTEVSNETVLGPDGYAYITKRHDVSAHFEKTIAITEDGNIVLTNW